MDTNTEVKSPTSPRIKFRWCRTVSCQTKEVYLILTSITGGQVNLEWNNDLGWYESAIVSLPCGLHSGFLLIREKISSSFLRPDASQKVDERDYKIDPFFVSPHKFSIEIFLQSSRSSGLWRDNPFLREKYLSFHAFETDRDRDSEGKEHSLSPRKCSSCQELRKSVCGPAEEADAHLKAKTLQLSPREQKWTSRSSSSGLEDEENATDHFRGTNLRKWKSLGGANFYPVERSSLDSSYYSRSRSLYIDGAKNSESNAASPEIKLSKSDGDKLSSYIKPTKTLLFHADLHELKLDVLARSAAVEDLIKHSDEEAEAEAEAAAAETLVHEFQRKDLYFKEVNPPTNEGYGCLITFESRSTSMDDLGSPRALEDVLVSLTSTDTESKHYHSSGKETYTKEDRKDLKDEKDNLADNRFVHSFTTEFSYHRDEKEVPELSLDRSFDRSSVSEKNYSKYPESDITIHEDENFQYDSLKNEDHKIPLNIKDVLDSEDSDYSINLCSKASNESKEDLIAINHQQDKENSQEIFALKLADQKHSDNSEDSDCDRPHSNSFTGSYDFQNRVYPTSAGGAVATDSLVLVHPGSLRSETENENSDSLIQSISRPQAIKDNYKHTEVPTEERNKKIPNQNKTLVIIKDKRKPKMNSTGTQTSCRILSGKPTQSLINHSLPTFASKYKENLKYSPLPNKISGPWTTKYTSDRVSANSYPYSENSNIKNLQNNLYNITKADQILRKIHPFDYRPSYIHNNNYNESPPRANHHTSSNSNSGAIHQSKSYLKSISDGGLQKLSSKTAKSIVFKTDSNTSSISSASSVLHKPVVSFQSPYRSSLPPKKYPISLSQSYSTPNAMKIVPKPHFSIYGKDFSDSSGEYRLKEYKSASKTSPFKSSSLYRGYSSPIRPTASLPDLRVGRESSTYSTNRHLRRGSSYRANSSPPSYKENIYLEYPDNTRLSNTLRVYDNPRRRRSLEGRFPLSGSSGESTDSLIEEADNYTHTFRRRSVPRSELANRSDLTADVSRRDISYSRKRARSSLGNITDTADLRSSYVMSPYRNSSSVTGALRTRSETDLRMVGKLSGGRHGEPPYLPYRKEHLSLGQIVKVLVPGEGVALARVVYNPLKENFALKGSHRYNQDITVVLISEPTSLTGSVITVPLNKILLAWPKV